MSETCFDPRDIDRFEDFADRVSTMNNPPQPNEDPDKSVIETGVSANEKSILQSQHPLYDRC